MSHDRRGQAATGDGSDDLVQLLRVRHDPTEWRFESVAPTAGIALEIATGEACIRACDRERKGLLYPLSYADHSAEGFEPPTR
jgi:hypothetical protein